MKILRPFFISVQCIIMSAWLLGPAEADPKTCKELVHPLHSKVNVIKDQGGIWDQFAKVPGLQNQTALALRVDSLMVGIMFTLDYLCRTQEGIPYNDVARYVVSRIREIGEEGFIEEHVALEHSPEKVAQWVEFGKFAESHLNRKLDLEQIRKTVEQSRVFIDRYKLLFESKSTASVVIAEGKTLVSDIEQFRATDPYIKQADYESSQTPHIPSLSNRGDTM